jgi:hypothetical protein
MGPTRLAARIRSILRFDGIEGAAMTAAVPAGRNTLQSRGATCREPDFLPETGTGTRQGTSTR